MKYIKAFLDERLDMVAGRLCEHERKNTGGINIYWGGRRVPPRVKIIKYVQKRYTCTKCKRIVVMNIIDSSCAEEKDIDEILENNRIINEQKDRNTGA